MVQVGRIEIILSGSALSPEKARRLAILKAAPEFPLRGNNQMLVERIGMGLLRPNAAGKIIDAEMRYRLEVEAEAGAARRRRANG